MRLTLAALAATLILASCTPEQLASFQQASGAALSASDRAALLDLPDVPMRLSDGREIALDGSISAAPVAPAGSRCPQHFAAALGAGWPASDWERLDHIMWRESRCNPRAHNPVGRDDSYGLMQLNMKAHRSWVGPMVGGDFSRLYDPSTNLRIGRILWERAGTYGCAWKPWTTRNTRWCG